MKISEIVMLDSLITGKSEEVKFNTREVNVKSLLSKDGFIERRINNNFQMLLWFLFVINLAACVLAALEFVEKRYTSVSMMLFDTFIISELIIVLRILKAYYSEGYIKRNKQNWVFTQNHWFWFVEKHQNDFSNKITDKQFLEKSFFEMNKTVLKFYLTNVIVVNFCLLVIALVILTNKPDIIAVSILLSIASVSSLYLFVVRRYILKKANSMFDARVGYNFEINDEVENRSEVIFLEFSLNVKYLIEE